MQRLSINRNFPVYPPLLLLAVLLLTYGSAVAETQPYEPAAPELSELTTLRWRASAMGQSVFGSACWLQLADGTWRLSIADNGPASEIDELCLSHSLNETGEGWTIVPSATGSAIVMPWRREFTDYGTDVAVYLKLAMLLFRDGPDIDPDDLPESVEIIDKSYSRRQGQTAFAGGDREDAMHIMLPRGYNDNPFGELADRLEGEGEPPEPKRNSFRDRMEQRGRGRGDDRETWTITWSRSDNRKIMSIGSSRRSGDLVLERVAAFTVSYLPDEVLMPLWPLADLIHLDRSSKR
jgi:hypothetical protein